MVAEAGVPTSMNRRALDFPLRDDAVAANDMVAQLVTVIPQGPTRGFRC